MRLVRSFPLEGQSDAFLAWSRSVGLAEQTVVIRRFALRRFSEWAARSGIVDAKVITREILEHYQAHLTVYRKTNGLPLAINTQVTRLNPLRAFFKWLARSGQLATNPAADLQVPRIPRRLPGRVPTITEVWRILAIPDTTTPTGVRDRAILETLYATGVRRMELAHIGIHDVNLEENAAIVRSGKGNRDRVVPVGRRASRWIDQYLRQVRPALVHGSDEPALFVTDLGQPFIKNRLGDFVRSCIVKARIPTKGACHLFRHACATHMLENGADIRYIQELLGHADLSTTQIYTHVSIGKLKAVHAATHPSARP